MKNRLALGLIAMVIVVGAFVYNAKNRVPEIRNFTECVKAGYRVGESYPRQCWTPDGRWFAEDLPDQQGGPITIRGEISCLPKKGKGPQTLECAIGLKSEDGRHYSLKNLNRIDPDNMYSRRGLRIEVSGVLVDETPKGPDGNTYDVVGTIDVQSIRESKISD